MEDRYRYSYLFVQEKKSKGLNFNSVPDPDLLWSDSDPGKASLPKLPQQFAKYRMVELNTVTAIKKNVLYFLTVNENGIIENSWLFMNDSFLLSAWNFNLCSAKWI
jgi:hypothetical protein